MSKSPDAFRTISEVADWLGVQAHVLRFWESKFSHVKPVKRAGGRRYYRPADMQLLGGIKKLLHDDGLTIKGVQKMLREKGAGHVSSFSQSLDATAVDSAIPDGTETATDTPKVVPFQPTQPRLSDEPAAQIPMDLEPSATPAPPDDAADQPAPEAPPLPSFLQRPLRTEPVAEAPKTEPDPAPDAQPVSAGPRVVDAPDPPSDESTIEAAPGMLSLLSRIDILSAGQAADIAPLVRELRQWMDQATQAGAR